MCIEDDEEDDEEKKGSQKSNGMESEKEDGKIEDEDDEEDSDLDSDLDDDEDEFDRTLLESYNSCIDENDEVDEFIIFRDTLKGKRSLNLLIN